MHNSIQITILLLIPFLQRWDIFVFPFPLASTTDEVEHPWGPSSNDDFLGILSSNFRPHNLRNALQGVNSMVKLVRTNCYCRYRGF